MVCRVLGFAFIAAVCMLPICYVQGQVSGKVFDANLQPIFGAHVVVRPSNRVYRTDEIGHFNINQLSDRDTLIVSHVAHVSDTLLVRASQRRVEFVLEERVVSFEDMVVTPRYDPSFQLAQVALQTKTINSSQELLKLIPGLFIGQHAGGGKAEQLFLRGFDLDHGTDLAITVDGMPVNMVSHAHGQGYSDLHFLIPESVQHFTFEKGPYAVGYGNFNVAGHVSFQTKTLMDNQVKVEWGQFGSRRLFGSFNFLNNSRHKSFIAAESYFTEGPFDSPQGLRKYNLLLKEQWHLGAEKWLSFRFMGFSNTWSASGQIPARLVKSGNLSRFGAVDDTEGGTTRRISLSSDLRSSLWGGSFFSQVDWIQYDFELFSNFTFFLNDPVNGDQIRQSENRMLINALARYESDISIQSSIIEWSLGFSFRGDRISDSELTQTRNRQEILFQRQFGDIREDNINGFASLNSQFGEWDVSAGIRYDYQRFSYNDQLLSNTKGKGKAFLSPKLKIAKSLSDNLQLMIKVARGFHSNDARVTTQTDTIKTTPAAYGSDLALNWQPAENVYINFAAYHLTLEQELVYVGDEGVVEPSGRSSRRGFEAGLKLEPMSGVFIHADINFADSRFTQVEKDQNYVPLAPRWNGTLSVDYYHDTGIQFGLTYAGMSDRPANEDQSIMALGYGITSVKCRYATKGIGLSLEVQNLFNVAWNEAQFATRSRLRGELQPVEELHFTPGTPFFIKSSISYRF